MSLINLNEIKYKVSSVLDQNTKQFGKTFLFDDNEETCWNSDQGKEQWIMIKFDDAKQISTKSKLRLKVQFQGGFSCGQCYVTFTTSSQEKISTVPCQPQDCNSKQDFTLSFQDEEFSNFEATIMKVTFFEPTDFFGRLIVYSLDLLLED